VPRRYLRGNRKTDVAALHQFSVTQDLAGAFQSAHPTVPTSYDACREWSVRWSFCCLHERHRHAFSDSSLYGTNGCNSFLQDQSAFY
jgi:hypothetical protein